MSKKIFSTLGFNLLLVLCSLNFSSCQVFKTVKLEERNFKPGGSSNDGKRPGESISTILVEKILKSTIQCSKDEEIKALASECLAERNFVISQFLNQSSWAIQRKYLKPFHLSFASLFVKGVCNLA